MSTVFRPAARTDGYLRLLLAKPFIPVIFVSVSSVKLVREDPGKVLNMVCRFEEAAALKEDKVRKFFVNDQLSLLRSQFWMVIYSILNPVRLNAIGLITSGLNRLGQFMVTLQNTLLPMRSAGIMVSLGSGVNTR